MRYFSEVFKAVSFLLKRVFMISHAKNFSFIYKRNKWHLAPAYDLTLCSGYNGEHATSVNNHGKPTIEDMLVVGESIRIPKKKGLSIIRQVADQCDEILSKDYKDAISDV